MTCECGKPAIEYRHKGEVLSDRCGDCIREDTRQKRNAKQREYKRKNKKKPHSAEYIKIRQREYRKKNPYRAGFLEMNHRRKKKGLAEIGYDEYVEYRSQKERTR